ncbi:hypothetical protein ACZ90_69180 [Streptomyces albus subsp. albus]|nr:hypothetical protein ACZ90_69180 [Streptomyces albus subsp. albus]
MTTRRLTVLVGALVLVLAAAGALAWNTWFRDGDGEALGDRCQGMLAVDEAREFFGGASLKVHSDTGEWGGYDTQWCSVHAEGAGGVQLRLQIRPRAAYRASGAAEESAANPIGGGWTGSYSEQDTPKAAVLVDCTPLAGRGLLVMAEVNRKATELEAGQLLQVARLATESARAAADHFGCQGALGKRPAKVDRTDGQERPLAQAAGTCRGAVDGRVAARLGITSVWERPGGRALTEYCGLRRGKSEIFGMVAYYGPSAQQERYLDGRYPGTAEGEYVRSVECGGALGTAYFKLSPGKAATGDGPSGGRTADLDAPDKVLASFTAASAHRHGCPAS